MKKPNRVMKNKAIEPMTMVEFKAWLKGIEDMQPDSWSPSPEQWSVIKQRLDSVILNSDTSHPTQPVAHADPYGSQMITEPYQLPYSLPSSNVNKEELLLQKANLGLSPDGGSPFA